MRFQDTEPVIWASEPITIVKAKDYEKMKAEIAALEDGLREAGKKRDELIAGNESLKRQLSEMKGHMESWQSEAWDTLSLLNKERKKNRELSSALTEQEACTGREIERTQAQKRWTQIWKDQANQALSELGKVVAQVVDLKLSLEKKQARAKRQTTLLKALRKEVGAEAFDKAYQDSLGAEKKKEMRKIADNWFRKMDLSIKPDSCLFWRVSIS